jgi:hypothetical protein
MTGDISECPAVAADEELFALNVSKGSTNVGVGSGRTPLSMAIAEPATAG